MLPYTRERTQFGKAIAEFQVGGRLGGRGVQDGSLRRAAPLAEAADIPTAVRFSPGT